MRRLNTAHIRKLARKAVKSGQTIVKKVAPVPSKDACYTIHDGYLMQFQREDRHKAIFLEDLYQTVRGDTVPEADAERLKRDLSIKLKIKADDISLRAMDQEGIHLDLDSRDIKVWLMAEFGSEAMIQCEYSSIQPRAKHDYSKVPREYSWKVLEMRGHTTPVHIAALYRRILKHDKLKFNLIS